MDGMSNTTTFNTDQARLYGRLAADTQVIDFDFEDLMDVLDALPGYTEFVFQMVGDRDQQWRLMARDLPRCGRRYTNLDTGMEWIDLRSIVLANDDVYGVGVKGIKDQSLMAMACVER